MLTARCPAFSGDPERSEQAYGLGVQVTQLLGLQPVGQDTKQKMAGQVRGRLPPEHGVPTAAKLTDAEIAQARNLAVVCYRRFPERVRKAPNWRDPCDGSFSETASLQSAGGFCAFFSGSEIPFPGNGDRKRQRLGSNGGYAEGVQACCAAEPVMLRFE